MNLLKEFPGKEELIKWFKEHGQNKVYNVNAHFHTPYSFSAFNDTSQVFELSGRDGVEVLGINDFFTTDGYKEFHDLCVKNKKFPLFNIEFMALQKEEQQKGTRVNDPSNPGRTYFCGKGLAYPPKLGKIQEELLQQVFMESMKQTRQMVEKLNAHLASIGAPFSMDFEEIKSKYCKEIVRERHIAKALRVKMNDYFPDDDGKKSFLEKLYRGKPARADVNDVVGLENEIRGNLLKTGGVAFVEEDDKAFLSLEQVIDIITNAGGIACYPTLLDDANGNYTDFEENFEILHEKLSSKNIYAIELIPNRNSFDELKKYVKFFQEKKYVITFGTEHNTPELAPLSISCRGNVPLDEELKEIGYEGACIIAANQYLIAKGEEGFADKDGKPKIGEKSNFVELGKAVIEYWIEK